MGKYTISESVKGSGDYDVIDPDGNFMTGPIPRAYADDVRVECNRLQSEIDRLKGVKEPGLFERMVEKVRGVGANWMTDDALRAVHVHEMVEFVRRCAEGGPGVAPDQQALLLLFKIEEACK